MNIGDTIPSYSFKATDGLNANLADYHGKWLILYFYPKDATPGCTLEGQDFRDMHAKFSELNAVIFGISRDNLACHERFKKKQAFSFELIEDSDENLCQIFDVMKTKKMFGKTVRGIQRSTFIIDPEGVVKHVWRKVAVEGHVAEVLSTLAKLQKL
jgi:peroxiredoxin Q/BCP